MFSKEGHQKSDGLSCSRVPRPTARRTRLIISTTGLQSASLIEVKNCPADARRAWLTKTAFCLKKARCNRPNQLPNVAPSVGANLRAAPCVEWETGGRRMRWDGATCQSTYAPLSFSVALPRWTMRKSEPIPFSCPSCKAEYKIVTIDVCDVQQGKIRCLKCDALLPAGEGRVAFKYFLVGRSRRK